MFIIYMYMYAISSLVEPSPGATSEKHQPVQATAEELTKLTHSLKIRVNKNIQYDREEDD